MITEKISNGGVLSGTINASSNLTIGIGSSNNLVGGNINTFTKETDPTIPDYIKEISEEDIAGWDNNTVVNEEQNKTLVGLEELIDTITPKATAKGELVHITDALNLPTFKTTADGNVKQETTKGNQLFDINDKHTVSSFATTDNDDWITISVDNSNGASTMWENYWTRSSNRLKPSTPYKIVLEVKNVSGTFNSFSVISVNSSYNSQFASGNSIKYENLKSNSIFVLQHTTSDDFTNSVSMLRSFVTFNVGQSGSITFRLSVLEDTTVTPETFVYEKYTGGQASPNPEYPQEIDVLEGYNLLKITTFTDGSKEQTKNGVTAIINDNGTITCKGTATDTAYFYFIKNDLDFTLGDGYFACNSPNTNQRIEFVCDVDGITRYLNSYGKGNFIKATTSFEFKHITMSFLKREKVDTTFTPMFAKGRYNKPFVPYGCICIRNSKNQLLDFSGTESYSGINKTFENDVLTVSGDGSTAYHSWSKNINHICFANPGKTLYFDYEDIKSASPCNGSVVQLNVRYNDGTQPLYLGMVLRNFTKKDVWTIPNDTSNIKEVSIGVYTSNASPAISNTITITKPRLSFYENSDYEPYQEQITYLDLKGNFVGKINDDIKDYLVTDKKKLWLVKNVNRGLIAMNNYPYETDTHIWYFFSKPTDSIDYNAYTTHGFSEVAMSGLNNPIRFDGGGNKPQYAIVYNKSQVDKIPTNDELKELIDGKYFYYQLAEPQIIELGELPEPIKTFEGVNNIQLLANLDTEIEVKYALDVKKYADDRYLELTNALVSTGANL